MSHHILIVEDDREFTRMLCRFLHRHGFTTDVLHTGDDAVDNIIRISPSLVILDVMLPMGNGFDICEALRDKYLGPILMLTALSDDENQLSGFECGADDYVGKPVKPEILLARIKALLKRSASVNEIANNELPKITVNQLVLCPKTLVGFWLGQDLELSSMEFELLYFMAKFVGVILARDRLYASILKVEYDGQDRALDLIISRLRKKMPSEIEIKGVRGKGYLLSFYSEDN